MFCVLKNIAKNVDVDVSLSKNISNRAITKSVYSAKIKYCIVFTYLILSFLIVSDLNMLLHLEEEKNMRNCSSFKRWKNIGNYYRVTYVQYTS